MSDKDDNRKKTMRRFALILWRHIANRLAYAVEQQS